MKLFEYICNSGISARVFEYLRNERDIISSGVPELRDYVSYLVSQFERIADNPNDSRGKRMFDPEWNRDFGHILHETKDLPRRILLPSSEVTKCYLSDYNTFPWMVAQHPQPTNSREHRRIPVYPIFNQMFETTLRFDYSPSLERPKAIRAASFRIVDSSSLWAPLLAVGRSSWLPYWSILFNLTGRDLDDDFCPHCQSREKYFRSSRLGVCVWGDLTEIVGIGYLVGQLLDECGDPIPYF